jgi:branched-chain amino acid transport system permease protein
MNARGLLLSGNRARALLFAAIAVALFFPDLAGPFDQTVMITFFLWGVLAVCWNLLLGFGGIPAFGNLLFFGIGGYASGYLAIHGLSPWLAMLVGTMLSVVVGLGVGAPTLRLKGIYVALFTFASEELLRNIVLLPDLVPWTGGSLGLQNIPYFPVNHSILYAFNYYFGFAILIVTCFSIYLLLRSRFGLALISLRESELYAESLGVNTYRHKLLAFAVAAFFSGLAGAFYAHYTGAFTAANLSFNLLIQLLVMILIGGLGTQYGPIIGALLLTFLTNYLQASLSGEMAQLRLLAIGLLIPIVLIFSPSGIAGISTKIVRRPRTGTQAASTARTTSP